MRNEWEEKRLGELIVHKKGFAFKSKEYISSGYPIVRVSNFTDRSIDMSECNYIDPDEAKNYKEFELKSGDIVIATVGSWPNNPESIVGKVIKVPKEADKALLNQNAVMLRATDKIVQNFLFYRLRNDDFSNYLVSGAQGSANQASITLESIFNFDFCLPPIPEQHAIASILGSLDDKIALNRSMNSTLEAIGQAFFRSWFVDFEFPNEEGKPYRSSDGEMVETELGEAPKGWRVGTFADLAEINKGDIVDGPFGSNLKSSDYTDFGIRLIHQENISEFNFIDEKKRYTSYEKAAELQRSVTFPGDIVMTKMPEPITRATRVPHNISKEFIIMADCIRIRPNPESTPGGYLLYLINSKSFRQQAEGLATGTTRPRINLTQAKSIKIVIPPKTYRKAFGMFSESLESLREKNNYEISILSSIRDALLPKLMSGEIRVSEETKL